MSLILTLLKYAVLFQLLDKIYCHQERELEKRIQYLREMSQVAPLMELNQNAFKQYIQVSPKNYSFIVLGIYHDCESCVYAVRELNIVAKSYRSLRFDSSNLFFGVAYLEELPQLIQKVKFKSVPSLVHVPANNLLYEIVELQSMDFLAENMAKWIQAKTRDKIVVIRPPDNFVVVMLFATFGLFVMVLRENGVKFKFLFDNNFWGIIVVVFCIAMSSGQMWNYIENPPFCYESQDGEFGLIYHSTKRQYLIETYIIMAIYLAISGGIVILTESKRNEKKKSGNNNALIILGILLLLIFTSLLMSIARMKMSVYPLRFFLD